MTAEAELAVLRAEASQALRQALAEDPLLAPGAELGFELGEELGRGGMGVVYRVHERSLGRDAALKLLHQPGPLAEERFLREARVTARLDHPGIPPVYEAGRAGDGRPFLLMRRVVGQTLTERIWAGHERSDVSGALPESSLRGLLRILALVAEALAYAHSQGVVHRDLKPDNVMLGEFGEVLVMDWGLARVLDEGESSRLDRLLLEQPATAESGLQTRHGAILGTPGFIAPEQLESSAVDERADVFSLGAMLLVVLCGELPYPSDSVSDVLAANASGPPPLPSARGRKVDPALEAIVRRATAWHVAARYPSAEAFAADLEAYLAGEPVSVYTPGWLSRVGAASARRPLLVGGPLLAALIFLALSMAISFSEQRARDAARRTAASRAGQVAEEASRRLAERSPAELPDPKLWIGQRRRLLGPALAEALAALLAAQRWRALASGAQEAERARFEAALELARLGVAGEQWAVTEPALDEASAALEALPAGDDLLPLQARLDRVRRAVSDEATRRGEAIKQLLVRAENGQLPALYGVDEAAFELLQVDGSGTLSLEFLLKVLNYLSGILADAERQLWLSVVEPSPAGAAAGEVPLEALPAAVERWLEPGGPPPPAPERDAALREAARLRLCRRIRGAGQTVPSDPALQEELLRRRITQAHDEALWGEAWPDLSRLLTRTLGYLAAREARPEPALVKPARDGLIAYLERETHPGRAAEAATALCRIGGDEARDAVEGALQRFSQAVDFRRLVGPKLALLDLAEEAPQPR